MKIKNKKILFLILLTGVLISPAVARAVDFCGMIANVQSLTYQIGGSIVIIGWVIAGILYLTAAGNPEKTGIAKKAMIAAIIGTVLIIIAGISSSLIVDALKLGGAVPRCGTP